MARYTRRELAQKTGFGFEALRYYEILGILPHPDRSASNYRLYGEDAAERLLFVKLAKRCGFTLREIKRAMALIESTVECGLDADAVIGAKIAEIESRIRDLSELKLMLEFAKENLKGSDCGKLSSYLDLVP